MIRIIADSSTMYSPSDAKEKGFDVAPLTVTIDGESYRELDEITGEEFVQKVREGHMPKSSQPSVGEVMALYDQYKDDEILNIAMADGLSGTYSSAVAAAQQCSNTKGVTVLNTRTLCGPHRYMAEVASRLAASGWTKEKIIERLEEMMKNCKSFLLPCDFDFLRRGGRLSPLVSFVGKTIKLAPVLTQSADGRQLVMASVKRSFKQAVSFVGKTLQDFGVGDGWRVYITHADDIGLADRAKEMLKNLFPKAVFETHHLTPAFVTQGGPGCVAIQVIKGE